MTSVRWCACLLAALLLALPAAADQVHLKSGQVLEGKAVRHGDRIEVKLGFGSMWFRADEVVRIVKSPSPAERKAATEAARRKALRDRIAKADPKDAQALYRVILWARDNGYDAATRKVVLGLVLGADPDHAGARHALGQVRFGKRWVTAEESKRMIAEADQMLKVQTLEQRIRGVALKDARKLYDIARWARGQGFDEHSVTGVIRLVLGADPNHAGARSELGQVQRGGRWMSPSDARAIDRRDHAVKMRAKGYVWFGGRWMTAAEADWQSRVKKSDRKAYLADSARRRAESRLRDVERQLAGARRDQADKIADLERQRDRARSDATKARRWAAEQAGKAMRTATALERTAASAARDAADRARRLEGKNKSLDDDLAKAKKTLAAVKRCLEQSESLRRRARNESERGLSEAKDALTEARRSKPNMFRLKCLLEDIIRHCKAARDAARKRVD